jgi:hypothetical protein
VACAALARSQTTKKKKKKRTRKNDVKRRNIERVEIISET